LFIISYETITVMMVKQRMTLLRRFNLMMGMMNLMMGMMKSIR